MGRRNVKARGRGEVLYSTWSFQLRTTGEFLCKLRLESREGYCLGIRESAGMTGEYKRRQWVL